MTQFRTVLTPTKANFSISPTDNILCMGSCFAEHIGQRLQRYKFSTLVNPYGILYNPISIQIGLAMLMNEYRFGEKDIFQHNQIWHSYYHHSRFSSGSSSELLDRLKRGQEKGIPFLKQTNRLIITLGTAYVYIHRKLGEVVANCHKLPANDFTRRRLSVNEVVTAFLPLFKQLQAEDPILQIILTVSPVRHIRDGIVENQRSKATLILAAEQLAEKLNFVSYFPAYELLMDDLRDYRFYEKDYIHPNEMAIDYIWNFFKATYFDSSTENLLKQIEKILKASQHRPFHPHSEAHQRFLKNQLQQLQKLEKEHQTLDFKEERKILERQVM